VAAQREPPDTLKSVLLGALVGVAPSTTVLLLMVALIALTAAKWLHKAGESDAARVGWAGHLTAWLAGYALVFVALGMAPAEIISPTVQTWLINGSAALLAVVIVGWLLWKIAVRRKFQYSLRSLFVLTFFWALLLGVLKMLDVLPGSLGDFWMPTPCISPRGWYGVDAQELRKAVVTGYGNWTWAIWQWFGYSGPYISVALALALVALWHRVRNRATSQAKRDRWASLLRCLGRSALAAVTVWLLLYLAVAPSVVQSIDSAYQTRMEYVRNPQAYRDDMLKTIAEVRADTKWMDARAGADGGK
jgi:hypothetical protein